MIIYLYTVTIYILNFLNKWNNSIYIYRKYLQVSATGVKHNTHCIMLMWKIWHMTIRRSELMVWPYLGNKLCTLLFSPVLISPRHSCVQKEKVWDIEIRPVLNLPADNENERDENKTRANILLYTVQLII